ncbi:ATP synthase subunit gamma, mitochondrial [Hyalella azteca]|nr:ATP synthase subunit gamma, mitochondrial [Hyalella azteca]
MATLKTISMRLKSVKNIQKITQSMKMVSAAKYARAERDLKPVRPYGQGAAAFYEKIEAAPVAEKPKELIIAMSSDRGLCGGIHSAVCKMVKAELAASPNPENIGIVCIGDKARAQLQRVASNNILFQVNEVGRKVATFEDAAVIASAIINSGYDFGSGKIIFNKFKSVVAYNTTVLPVFTADSITSAEKLSVYDSLDADVIQSYMEYSLASLLFYAFKEGACSEQSARMTAMDGASKNAGEMIEKLTLTFNRTRQAVITGELIEIISGAAAL